MARALWLADVLDDLRGQGVPVHFVPGWQARGSETFDPAGIICHDTGGSASSSDAGEIGVLINGRVGLSGPIAQLYLSRTTGVHLVAAGRCNHAKTGWAGPNSGLGNTRLIGIEAAANPGRAWPADQYRWYTLLVAAICRHRGWSPYNDVAAHREHQPGEKVDPQGIDMGPFRAQVQQIIDGGGDDMAFDDECRRWLEICVQRAAADIVDSDTITGIQLHGQPKQNYPNHIRNRLNMLATAAVASAQREQDMLTAIAALAQGGGSVDVGVILTRIDARTADVTGLIADQAAEIDRLQQLVAELRAAQAAAARAEADALDPD